MSASIPIHPRKRDSVPFRLSEQVFGFRWPDLVPCGLGSNGARLRAGTHSEVRAFLATHRRLIVAPELEGSRFAQLEEGPAKERFCDRAVDSFVIEQDGEPVGVFVGQAWDWSTYYLRYLAMLPGHQGHGAVAGIVDRFGTFLGPYGFERMEVDVSVSHLRQLRRLIGCGFHVMGTLHSERWGAMVHLVRFLSERHEEVFLSQFSAGLRSRMAVRSDGDGAEPPHRTLI